MSLLRRSGFLITLCGLLCRTQNGWADESASTASLTFEQHIRPILRAHCYDCHGATEELQGGLDLRQVRLMQQGGDSGSVLTPGSAADSYLLDRVESGEMPPGDATLTATELRTLRTWVDQGAHTVRPEPESLPPGLGLTPEERAFWFFQPVSQTAVPEISDSRAQRVANPIDAFLLSAMPAELSFSPEADRPTLIRRAALDLTGLPPTFEDIQRWTSNTSGDWYEQLIEELLASPHYGERWGRHWLDVAGYADSEGYSVADAERPWAWKYRDYVIRSMNADKPFDQFLLEQLAGDELAGPVTGDLTAEQTELLTATGFLRMAADGTGSGSNDETARNQVVTDTIKIVSSSLLGLTVACAQCHDHRYDPIPQTDYYALRSVFEPALDWKQWQVPSQRLVSLATAADRQRSAEIDAEAQVIVAERTAKQSAYMLEALEQELTKYDEPLRTQLRDAWTTPAAERSDEHKALLDKYPSVNISPGVLYQYLPKAAEDLKTYDARIAEVRAKKPPEEFLRVLREPAGHAPQAVLFHRGDYQQPRQPVLPAALTVACPEDQPVAFALDNPELQTTGRRLAFARWLASSDNPLTARVLVNRFWLHHFGRGIVNTPADFGLMGARPSHPELLDWLAAEFIRSGFHLKHMHRLMLTSSAWKQSTERTAQHEKLDPDNRWFSRRMLLRLDAEIVRDRMLAVSGRLDPALFGPPVPVKEDDAGQVLVDTAQTRRSLYIKMRRSQPVAMLQAFDAPVMETNCELRPVSTVATQSLMLMNSQTVLDHAKDLAERCQREPVILTDEQRSQWPEPPPSAASTWQFGYGRYHPEANAVDQFTVFPHWTGSAWQGGATLPDAALGFALLRAEGGHPDLEGYAVIRRWTAPQSGIVNFTGTLGHQSTNGDGVRGRLVSSRQGLVSEWVAFNTTTTTEVGEIHVQAGDVLDLVTDCRTAQSSDSFTWPARLVLTPAADPPAFDPQTADGSGSSAQNDLVRTFDTVRGFHGPLQTPSHPQGQILRAWQLTYGREATPAEQQLSLQFLIHHRDALEDSGVPLPEGREAMQESLIHLCHALITSNEFLYVD